MKGLSLWLEMPRFLFKGGVIRPALGGRCVLVVRLIVRLVLFFSGTGMTGRLWVPLMYKHLS